MTDREKDLIDTFRKLSMYSQKNWLAQGRFAILTEQAIRRPG